MQNTSYAAMGAVLFTALRGILPALCLLLPATLPADTVSALPVKSALVIPRVIVDGIEKYRFSGADEAVKIWLEPIRPQTQEAAAAYAEALRDAEGQYGKFVGYHLVSIKRLSAATTLVYLALNYEYGPLFARFLVYEYKSNQLVTHIEFGYIPEAVFPEDFLY